MLALTVYNPACQAFRPWKGALSRDLVRLPSRLAARMLCECCAALRCVVRGGQLMQDHKKRPVVSKASVILQSHLDGPDGCANSARLVSISAMLAQRCRSVFDQ